MLPVTSDEIRLFLHVLAAAIWVGGQFTLAGLVPVLRGFGPDATKAAARRFNVVAWSAFAVLLATGVWNLVAVEVGDASDEYLLTLMLKLTAVAVAGGGALLHILAKSTAGLAIGGTLVSIGSLASLFFGVVLR